MDKRIKGLVVACCSLGAWLLAAGPAWSVAAQEPKPLASATLEQLDQIVVNGKRMEQRMLESERRFYTLYNKLNANDHFDVTCNFQWRDPNFSGYGASGDRRSCVPKFFDEAVSQDVVAVPASCGFGGSGGLSSTTPRFSTFNSYGNYGGYNNTDGSFNLPIGRGDWHTSSYTSCASTPQPVSARARLLWVDRREAFLAHLNKVMRSDPQLQTLGVQFQSLIAESDDAQKMAREARKLRVELRLAARKCPAPTSPRGLTKGCKNS